jgi:hypothetical protein
MSAPQHPPSSLSQVLQRIHAVEGIAGLYSGLYLQLSHTALKAAFVMSMKEKIGKFVALTKKS